MSKNTNTQQHKRARYPSLPPHPANYRPSPPSSAGPVRETRKRVRTVAARPHTRTENIKDGAKALSVLAGGLALAAGISSALNSDTPAPSSGRFRDLSQNEYNRAIKHTLKDAYTSNVAIKDAKDTGRRIALEGQGDAKHAVVKIKLSGREAIGGGLFNPSRILVDYAPRPLERTFRVDEHGKTIGTGAAETAKWSGDRGKTAEIYPNLEDFSAPKPTTMRYIVGVGATGKNYSDQTVQDMFARHASETGDGGDDRVPGVVITAGAVDVTGSNGKITGLDIVQQKLPHQSEPTIVHMDPGQQPNDFLR